MQHAILQGPAADELGGVRVIDRDRQRLGISPPYKSRILSFSLQPPPNKLGVSGVVREGHLIPESTCWTSPIVIQPVEKRPFWSDGKKHVFLWKLAPAQEKD